MEKGFGLLQSTVIFVKDGEVDDGIDVGRGLGGAALVQVSGRFFVAREITQDGRTKGVA